MNNSRACMSIYSIVDTNQDAPLSPPDSFKSRSPSLSPNMDYMNYERRNSFQLPMSVEERRHRNKLASAKYRAKKVIHLNENILLFLYSNILMIFYLFISKLA